MKTHTFSLFVRASCFFGGQRWLLLGRLVSVLWCGMSVLGFAGAEERLESPAARLLANEFASEHWELTARFDSGHLMFVNFLITNIGWGDRNAVVSGHLMAPDGKIYNFDNARYGGQWRLSADRLRFEVGSNILDLHEPICQLSVEKKNIHLDLRFHADGPAIWSDALNRSGYHLTLLAAAVPVEGTIWVKDMPEPLTVHGVLAATHSWLKETGAALVVRRLEFFSLCEDFPLYGVDLTTPTNAHWRWLVGKQQERKFYESDAFALSFADEPDTQQEDPGYSVPGKIQLKSPMLDGQVQLERVVLRMDPFVKLPRPVRFLVSLTLNLHPRRIWARSPFTLTLNPTPVDASLSSKDFASPSLQQGLGVTALTFLNPLPQTPGADNNSNTSLSPAKGEK